MTPAQFYAVTLMLLAQDLTPYEAYCKAKALARLALLPSES